jgi:GTP:adenosylcobinamide-phosphate guanylyltransferase
VRTIAPGLTPSASVRRTIEDDSVALPLLVTTADHPLLTPAMVEHFCRNAPAAADVVVAVAAATEVRRQYPDTIRTFYRFAGEGYSGCNLFLVRSRAAAKAATFWSDLERHRKRPWRLVAAVGLPTLGRFLIGRLSLDEAMRRLSKMTGATVQAMVLPFAEAAIDVDKPADLALVERILTDRA